MRAAAAVVARVAAGRSLRSELQRAAAAEGSQEHAALTDLCFGTLRSYGRVQAIVRAIEHRPASDRELEALLWCALYALDCGRYAAHTVVNQAVIACVALHRQRAKSYVNALLRAYLRRQQAIAAQLAADPIARWQHPGWWIKRVQAAYPDRWQEILGGGNSRAPMCLRVNRRRGSATSYLERLADEGIAARWLGQEALLLESPMASRRLPGFADGEVSVQDAGAQRVPLLLDLRAGQRVLDACAAPGGKCAHLLETADVALTALELQGERAGDVVRNLARLGLAAEVRTADCSVPEQWWDGRGYDRILADVPCTASGVARRHPDMKWLRRDGDVAACAARQARILEALWRVLAPNGKLLYVTCSVFPDENDAVVDVFLARTANARRLPLPDRRPQQLLPAAEHDGFYFALLEKTA
ncbi:MAG: 16S rRNA (cytosine(967)-C(5))-methyltransferase RsmB [Betaproteobacteria bacterium]|nr:MAG: 16S rRNA (cytosine(967)-C(5))-methyltransferase RsmB [Betaproteobacteria bacterium]